MSYTEKAITAQYYKSHKYQGVDFNITPKQVFALLENATTSRDRDLKDNAKELLQQMNDGDWTIRAGGLGGAGRVADPNPHITLNVAGVGHHINYKYNKQNQMLLVRIT